MKKENKTKYIVAGAVSGYIGQYIGDQIYNFIKKEKEALSIISSDNAYIASIISGAVVGALAGDISTFQSVIVSVGLFYAIYESLATISNVERDEVPTYEEILSGFFQDVVVVYILFTFWNKLFGKKKNEENRLVSEQIIVNIINGIIVTTYYSGKRIANT